MARSLLLLFAFAIPWEYSLDLGEPFGNIARVVGVLLLLTAIPAVLAAGRVRPPGPMQWLVLAFFLWFCCSYFWTIEPLTTLDRMRSYFQEIMIVWLVWEFAESALDLRWLLRSYVAGSWVLAILTVANLASAETAVAGQIRYAASGQDPNDVARFLDIGFPLAALLLNSERRWSGRILAAGFLPLGLVAVLLTASRGGFLGAVLGLAASALVLTYGRPRRLLAGAVAVIPMAGMLWLAVPSQTFERLATISEQLQTGDLNQRINIWDAGWHAFVRAPILGTGAGSFVAAAGLAPIDTAHNTALSIAVTGGLCALFLAVAIVVSAIASILKTRGPVQWAMAIALATWAMTSMVATVEENRSTWLLLALIALAGRLAVEQPEEMAACFSTNNPQREFGAAHEQLG
jgi:O-antigen ligase